VSELRGRVSAAICVVELSNAATMMVARSDITSCDASDRTAVVDARVSPRCSSLVPLRLAVSAAADS
jgi:hypothetical protein